ncbi:hypothetical protein OE88DRAFT_1806062 [Heliocybe sulcata]|uniref:Uncharacterized protein n=1 Tax=Heliocybe sulcata TaxID=5364 RepID=A0A5C3NBN9_9AGAM|nr:hypothetical protein OE88DRAFT_1806062 [Heliocybe sulcata]
MSDTLFARLCVNRYAAIKANHPGEGRRKLKLRIAEEFFNLSQEDKKKAAQDLPAFDPNVPYEFLSDGDPSDAISTQPPGEGIIVRTDYSDADAWNTFCAELVEVKNDLLSDSPEDAEPDAEGEEEDDHDAMDEDEDDEDDEDELQPSSSANEAPFMFHILSLGSPSDHSSASSPITSNLSALRLLNDVSLRAAPLPAFGSGIKRIKPPNRLIDHDGWQEIYLGKTIWVYDAQSNRDGCVRLVSQKSADAPYGTATGDSWRVRASHIPELQLNIASGSIKIDFGGLDSWNYEERQRNLQEATQPISRI